MPGTGRPQVDETFTFHPGQGETGDWYAAPAMRFLPQGSGDRGRRLPDTGPSAIRYLVVLTLTGFAMITAGAVLPSIGHSVRMSFCGAGDTTCAEHAIPRAPLGRCRVLSHADTVTDDAVVFTDDLGQSGTLTLSRTVDKNAVVHWFVRTDVMGGRLTEFASEDTAREYIIAAQHRPVRERLGAADPTGLLSRLAGRIDGHEVVTRTSDAFFVDGGNALDLGNEARSGVTGARIGGGMAGIAEVKTSNAKAPVSSLYLRLTPAAGNALGLLLRPGIGVQPSPPGLGIASIAFDGTGRPERLTIEAAGRLPGRLGPPFGGAGPNVMAGLLTPGPNPSPGQFTGRVSISIALGDNASTDVAADALHAIGVPLLLDRGTDPEHPPRRSVQSFYRLLDRGTADSSVTVNTYRTSSGSKERPTVTLGLQGGLTIADALPDRDYYYAPGQGFVEWQRCG
jgi:hypothetical protein